MQGKNDQQDQIETIVGLHNYIPDDNILKKVGLILKTGWVHEMVRDCYEQNVGRPSVDPEAALRLMLSGFLLGIVHDRELMRRAATDIAIRWFCGYKLADRLPDHSSLTRTRQRWGKELFREMFQRIVRMCVEEGLVGCDTIHVDSTLIRANVSIKSMVDEYIVKSMEENIEDEEKSDDGDEGKGGVEQKGPQNGPRKTGKLRKRKRGRSRKRKRSATDPDVVMSKSSKGGRFIPAYKGHLAVDDRCGVVVDVAVTEGSVNENTQLIDQVERLIDVTGKEVGKVTADAQYATGANFSDLEAMGIDPVIPVQPEKKKSKRIPARRFKYDEMHDHVVCPNGRKLQRVKKQYRGWVYSSTARDCRGCPLRDRCLYEGVVVRRIYIADGHPSLTRARRRKDRWREECSETYRRHRWIVEGRIAEAKLRHGMARAVRRGLDNVSVQMLLAAMAINLKRLASSLFMPSAGLLERLIGVFIGLCEDCVRIPAVMPVQLKPLQQMG